MKHRIILPLLAFLLVWTGGIHCEESVQNGFADLSEHSFSRNGAVKLDGPWEFVFGEYVDPDTLDDDQPYRSASIVNVPGKWSEAGIEGVGSDGYGYGTYRLRIMLPENCPLQMAVKIGFVGTSYRLFIDGLETAAAGNPGTGKASSLPKWQSQVAEFSPADRTVELVLHTANFHDTTSGVMDSIWLGTVDQAYRVRYGGLMYELFLFGVLLIMGFYHLGLYFHYRSDRAPLFFSLMTFVFALRIVVYGELFIYFVLPSISWSVLTKTGYLTFSLAVLFFFLFIYQLFRDYVHRLVLIAVDGISILYSLIIIFTPASIYQRLLTAFQLFTLAVSLYILYVLVRAARGKKTGAGLFIIGFLFMFVTLIHDIIKAMVVLPTIFLVPFGLFVFIFFQSMVLTKKFAVAFQQTEQMSAHLLQLNTSLERFVPREFLQFLEKESLMDIQLGDHANHTMTIMFADIRDFTSLSEKLTPEENFRFINSYLNRMGPIIRNHGGFVDKYLGDGIMALFPERPEDALDAAIELRLELERYNHDRAKMNYEAINFGVGIHTGDLMLGTIGENQRMDGTVISDAVNLASRIETLTKKFDIGIALSKAACDQLRDPGDYIIEYLGMERVKGKQKEIAVYVLRGRTRSRREDLLPAGDKSS